MSESRFDIEWIRAKFSARDIVNITGISRTTARNWLAGKSNIPPQWVDKIINSSMGKKRMVTS
jgi:hypothetical protein